jgi:hypothetical protein
MNPALGNDLGLACGAGLFQEKNTADWFILREKYCRLMADKRSEANGAT